MILEKILKIVYHYAGERKRIASTWDIPICFQISNQFFDFC